MILFQLIDNQLVEIISELETCIKNKKLGDCSAKGMCSEDVSFVVNIRRATQFLCPYRPTAPSFVASFIASVVDNWPQEAHKSQTAGAERALWFLCFLWLFLRGTVSLSLNRFDHGLHR